MRRYDKTGEGAYRMDRETAIKNATAYAAEVCKVLHPLLIIMYGSCIKDTATKESDIDLAVIFNGNNGNWLYKVLRTLCLQVFI